MKQEELTQAIRTSSPQRLHSIYECVCETYRQRLLEQFEFAEENAFWIGNVVGELLDVDCYYTLSMQDIVLIVDKAMSFDDFYEWYDQMIDTENHRRINLENWLKGVRPEMFNNVDKEEHE